MDGGTSGRRAHCLQRSLISILLLCIVTPLFLSRSCSGYPRGVNIDACESMTPNHNQHVSQPLSTSPFEIRTSKSVYTYAEEVDFHVSLKDTDVCFKGLYAQVRGVPNGDVPVGRFPMRTIPDFAIPLRACSANFELGNSTVTHLNGSSICQNFTLTWRAPMFRWNRDVQLFLTMVVNYSTFWVKLTSDVVSFRNGVGQTPTTELLRSNTDKLLSDSTSRRSKTVSTLNSKNTGGRRDRSDTSGETKGTDSSESSSRERTSTSTTKAVKTSNTTLQTLIPSSKITVDSSETTSPKIGFSLDTTKTTPDTRAMMTGTFSSSEALTNLILPEDSMTTEIPPLVSTIATYLTSREYTSTANVVTSTVDPQSTSRSVLTEDAMFMSTEEPQEMPKTDIFTNYFFTDTSLTTDGFEVMESPTITEINLLTSSPSPTTLPTSSSLSPLSTSSPPSSSPSSLSSSLSSSSSSSASSSSTFRLLSSLSTFTFPITDGIVGTELTTDRDSLPNTTEVTEEMMTTLELTTEPEGMITRGFLSSTMDGVEGSTMSAIADQLSTDIPKTVQATDIKESSTTMTFFTTFIDDLSTFRDEDILTSQATSGGQFTSQISTTREHITQTMAAENDLDTTTFYEEMLATTSLVQLPTTVVLQTSMLTTSEPERMTTISTPMTTSPGITSRATTPKSTTTIEAVNDATTEDYVDYTTDETFDTTTDGDVLPTDDDTPTSFDDISTVMTSLGLTSTILTTLIPTSNLTTLLPTTTTEDGTTHLTTETTTTTTSTTTSTTQTSPSGALSTKVAADLLRSTKEGDTTPTPSNDNKIISMIFTIGNHQYDSQFKEGEQEFAKNMSNILSGLNWRSIGAPSSNFVRASSGSVIAEMEIVFEEPLDEDATTDAVFVVYDQVNSPGGFDPLYNVTKLEVIVNGQQQTVDPCFGTRCPTGLNCSEVKGICMVKCERNDGYCVNNATCQEDQVNEVNLTCLCTMDFEGLRCDIPKPVPTPIIAPNAMDNTIFIAILLGSFGAVMLVVCMGLLLCMVSLLRSKASPVPSRDPTAIPIFHFNKGVRLNLIQIDDNQSEDDQSSITGQSTETAFDHPSITADGGVRFPSLPDLVPTRAPDWESDVMRDIEPPSRRRRGVSFNDLREVLEPDGSIGIEDLSNFSFQSPMRQEINGNVLFSWQFDNERSSSGTPSRDETPT